MQIHPPRQQPPNVKVCDQCKQPCQFYSAKTITGSDRSEWYCPNCHKSYPLYKKDIEPIDPMHRLAEKSDFF